MNLNQPVILKPSAHVLVRGRGQLQFGLDASRAGIAHVKAPSLTLRALRTARRPTPRDVLAKRVAASGLSAIHSFELIDDLIAHHVLVRATPLCVTLIGDTPLAQCVADMLRQRGVKVRIPLADEDVLEVLHRSPIHRPVVVVDRFGFDVERLSVALSHSRRSLLVTLIDERGLIGPIRRNGEGPCPMCVELHWVSRDAYFHTVARQVFSAGGQARQDPVSVAATAAAAVAVLVEMCEEPRWDYPPGECLVVDPYRPESAHRFQLDHHPGCPVCFASGRVA